MDIPTTSPLPSLEAAAHTGDAVLMAAVAAAASAGANGRSPSSWPGTSDCCAVMRDPAVTLTARQSSPSGRRTPPGSATPDSCLLRPPDAAVGYLSDAQRRLRKWRTGATPPWYGPPLSSTARCVPCSPVPPATSTGVVGYQIADHPASPPYPPGPARPLFSVGRLHRPCHQRRRLEPPWTGCETAACTATPQHCGQYCGSPWKYRRRSYGHRPLARRQPWRHNTRRRWCCPPEPASVTLAGRLAI